MATKFKYDENCLLDTFSVSGNTFEGLKETLKELMNHTLFMKWRSEDIELLSFEDIRDMDVIVKNEEGVAIRNADGTFKRETIPVIASTLLTPGNLPSMRKGDPLDTLLKAYRVSSVKTDELLHEWTELVKLAFVFNGDNDGPKRTFYLASSAALQTMDRFGMSGEFLGTPSLERDMLIAKQFERDLGVTVIARAVNGTKKVFSILSDKYTPIDQFIFFKIIKKLEKVGDIGKAECYNWEVNNFFTKLYVEFPEKAHELSVLYGLKKEMIPGILITTSDTGDSSFKVRGTWRISGSNSLIIHTEIKRKHIGSVDINEIVSDISDSIFAEYAKLPEALCSLMAQDITNPKWDLTSQAGMNANKEKIENIFKEAFKKLAITKAIGKKSEKSLREATIEEMDMSIPYTAYDIAMIIMGLPERAVFMGGKAKRDITNLQKACGNAPFIKYDTNDEVVLTA